MMAAIFRSPFFIAWLIVLYCAVNSLDLIAAWQTAPYERYAWLVLALWCSPLFYYFIGPIFNGKRTTVNSYLLGSGLAISLLGTFGELHLFHHAGLALSLAGLLPWQWEWIPWIICSVSWMPAIGWMGSFFPPDILLIIRVLLAGISAWWVINRLSRQAKGGQ